jgi:AAA ATPase domain
MLGVAATHLVPGEAGGRGHGSNDRVAATRPAFTETTAVDLDGRRIDRWSCRPGWTGRCSGLSCASALPCGRLIRDHGWLGCGAVRMGSGREMSVAAYSRAGTLLERGGSLAALNELLARVRSSSEGRLVLLGGEADVGKTALLRAFCEAQGTAVRILWGGCEPLRTPRPLGPLVDVGEAVGGELRDLVMGAARPYEVTLALLGELRAGKPTVLTLEDVHWADEATLDATPRWRSGRPRRAERPCRRRRSWRSASCCA